MKDRNDIVLVCAAILIIVVVIAMKATGAVVYTRADGKQFQVIQRTEKIQAPQIEEWVRTLYPEAEGKPLFIIAEDERAKMLIPHRIHVIWSVSTNELTSGTPNP